MDFSTTWCGLLWELLQKSGAADNAKRGVARYLLPAIDVKQGRPHPRKGYFLFRSTTGLVRNPIWIPLHGKVIIEY